MIKRSIAILLLGTCLAATSGDYDSKTQTNQQTPTNQSYQSSQITKKENNDIQKLPVYQIPLDNYYIIEIDNKSGCCLESKKENDFNITEGRILIEKIDQGKTLNKNLEFIIEDLKESKGEDKDKFYKGCYGLEPGEYRFWIQNMGYYAPFKTIRSKYLIQITPKSLDKSDSNDIPIVPAPPVIKKAPEVDPKA
jgi:hypothetical protein